MEGAPKLRWGVLGAGRIAADFVTGIRDSKTGRLVAVGSHDPDRARKLAGSTVDATGYGSYREILENPGIDAVYVATLHPQHLELIVAAADAGKHILCEKPLTMNSEEAAVARSAASDAGVLLVEAMMYRFQPQTAELRRLLSTGAIGAPRHIEVSCSFVAPFSPEDRLFNRALGGGAILDVGCYAMSFARMIAGWVAGDDAIEPKTFEGAGHIGEGGVDDWAVASLYFESGVSAHVRTGTRLDDGQSARVYGTEGRIEIANPWAPGRGGVPAEMVLSRVGDGDTEIIVAETKPLFGAEIDAVAQSVGHGQASEISVADSIATMRCLDRWRAAVGATGPVR